MSQFVETPTKAFTAGVAIAQYLRVKITAGKLAIAGVSDVEIGTIEEAAFADGDIRAVRLRTAQGTRKMVAAGPITAGNPVYAAASGLVDATGTIYNGTALETVTALNDIIEVLPGPNTDVTATITGTNAVGFLVDADSATPKIKLMGQAAGTGDFTVTMKPASTLTANRTPLVPDLDGTVALVDGGQVFTSPVLTTPQINNPALTFQYVFAGSAITADRTVTMPLLTAGDTFVFAAFVQALSNKSVSDALLFTAGAGAAAVIQRFGKTATEGLEIRVIDEIVTTTNAVENNLTETVPTGAVILSAQANLDSLIVGDGSGDNGLVKVGIGTTADPDKYGKSADLVKNHKIDMIPAWAVLSGAETICVKGCDAAGAAVTEKFNAGGFVRVRVVYLAPNSLDDAA